MCDIERFNDYIIYRKGSAHDAPTQNTLNLYGKPEGVSPLHKAFMEACNDYEKVYKSRLDMYRHKYGNLLQNLEAANSQLSRKWTSCPSLRYYLVILKAWLFIFPL